MVWPSPVVAQRRCHRRTWFRAQGLCGIGVTRPANDQSATADPVVRLAFTGGFSQLAAADRLTTVDREQLLMDRGLRPSSMASLLGRAVESDHCALMASKCTLRIPGSKTPVFDGTITVSPKELRLRLRARPRPTCNSMSVTTGRNSLMGFSRRKVFRQPCRSLWWDCSAQPLYRREMFEFRDLSCRSSQRWRRSSR